jgi:hypothetical protein
MTFSSAPLHSRAFSLRAIHRQRASSSEASSSRAFPCRRRRRRRLPRATTAEREDAKEEPRGGEKKSEKKKIVIVGAGWGGWGAAKALSESEEMDVILLDGLEDPTGKTAPRTPSGKPFEAGVRGFWIFLKPNLVPSLVSIFLETNFSFEKNKPLGNPAFGSNPSF